MMIMITIAIIITIIIICHVSLQVQRRDVLGNTAKLGIS